MATVQISKRMRAWIVAVAVLTPMLVTGLNVWYTNHVDSNSRERNDKQQTQADMRWCGLLGTLTNPAAPPPTTDRGRQQLVLLNQLFTDLGCVR